MIKVEADFKGLEVFLTAYVERIGNLDNFLLEAGNYMASSIKQNMDSGGRPNSWLPLTHGQPSNLRFSGGLYNSIQITDIGKNWVSAGSSSSGGARIVNQLQFGFKEVGNPRSWRAIFKNLIRMGRYKEDYIGRGDGMIINPPREFIMWQTQGTNDIEFITQLLIKHLTTQKD